VQFLVVGSAALPFDVAGQLGASVIYRAPASGRLDRAVLLEQLRGADAVITLLRDEVDDEFFAAAPRLRIVANCAVGYDNIDLAAATRRQIPVTNTPGVLTDATADFAFALALAAARRLVEGDQLVRSGRWIGWEPGQLLGQAVAGGTMGIIGLGRIGAAVARRARGFSMNVIYSGPRLSRFAAELNARQVSVDELLSQSDVISIHCPLSPETTHLIDAAALARMKSTAILVNTARGACVDEAALARALDQGQLAGAGLDVFEREPEVDPGLLRSPRVVLAPHAGSATTRTRARMAQMCAEAIGDVLAGRRPQHVVNREVYE
jgi:glyoxylate reductase